MSEKKKFKVGDILVGLRGSPYTYTCEGAIVKVMRISERYGNIIFVRIVSGEHMVGSVYDVNSKYFRYYFKDDKEKIKRLNMLCLKKLSTENEYFLD